jgi:uncharacterized protein YkwD
MRLLLALLFLLASLYSQSQRETKIDPENFDVPFLEELVRAKINEIRVKKNRKALKEDSILYLAAKNHAEYMSSTGNLTHSQSKNAALKSPQSRAEYFGAKKYLVGENVLYTFFNSNVEGSKGVFFITDTYEVLADAIIHSWVTSPSHYKNFLDPTYQFSGLALSINFETQQVFVCQDFAKLR